MMPPEELLRASGIVLLSYVPGRYYSTCPQCSNARKRAHQKLKCLGITIDGDHVRWGCNHCHWTGPEKGSGGNSAAAPVRCHLYGESLRKVKNPPGRKPRFIWQHRNGKGEWENGTGGAKTATLLYRIDEVREAITEGETIAIVEGEKDADTLWRIGIPATCNAHGASEPSITPKWTSAHSKQLVGAGIVVFNDNDVAGYAHAGTIVARSIGIAKQVHRLDLKDEWPDIGAGSDVSDWLANGGTPERLLELIEAAPVIARISNDPTSESEAILAELNRDNAVVLDGGKTMVLRFEEMPHEADGEYYSYRLPTFLKFGDFRNFYLNRYIEVGEKNVSIGHWWLGRPERRQYRGVVFVPGGDPVIDGRLNLWCGWGVEPKRGDWPLLREHIHDVLAARDDTVDTYIFRWLAWTAQHPAEQAEVALVFLGGLGTGKGTLGKAMCRIFGQHARHLSSPEHLTGRFNEHLRQCCFLFGDECYGPKDKSAEGTLKRLITERTLQIEPKGRGVVEAPNCLHIMMASNNEWVIPAGAQERRFMVQEVADTHQQDPNWFGPIYQEMRSGGLAAMLYDLLHYDLGDWHPRQIVRTAALAAQQAESLSPFDAWWEDLLHDGYLPAGNASGAVISGDYQVKKFDGYLTDGSKKYRVEKRKGLYEQARTSSPALKRQTDAAFGRYLRKRKCGRPRVYRQKGWQLPPLDQCRTEWLTRFPDTVWGKPDITSWQGERDDDGDD